MSDTGGATASGELTAAEASWVVDDQWALGTSVGTIEAHDPQQRPLTFELSDASAPFAVDSNGLVTISAPLDRDAQSLFELTVIVGAGVDDASVNLTIRVTSSEVAGDQVPVLGEQRAIWIQARFSDDNPQQEREDQASIDRVMISLNDYLKQESMEQVSVPTWDITPLLDVGVTKKKANGDFRGEGEVRDLLVNAAEAYDSKFAPENYDLFFLSLPAGIISRGGALGVRWGDQGISWIPARQWTPGTIHEAFHMLGVGHADVLMGTRTYPAPEGTGGHDPYYFMGSEGSEAKEEMEGLYRIFAPINVPMKYRMGWLSQANLIEVDAPGTFRIYSDATTQAPGVTPYGLRFRIDNNTFVAGYEPEIRNSKITKRGVVVHQVVGDYSLLLDANPNSVPDDPGIRQALNEVAELSDGALALNDEMEIGDTPGGTWIVRLVAEGGSGEERWADVEMEQR